jgi:hypothetical protein
MVHAALAHPLAATHLGKGGCSRQDTREENSKRYSFHPLFSFLEE